MEDRENKLASAAAVLAAIGAMGYELVNIGEASVKLRRLH
jgi:hypothetical protein